MTYKITLPIAALILTACAAEPEYDISPRARAALPEGQDLQFVYRGPDKCYTYIEEDVLTGYQIELFDDDGRVCDPLVE